MMLRSPGPMRDETSSTDPGSMTHDTTSTAARPDAALLPMAPAVVAGLAALGMAAYQLLTPGRPQATFGSVSDWLRDLLFLGYLIATVAAVVVGRSRAHVPTAAAGLVSVGYGLLVVGVLAGLVLQEDPSWFFVLGGPGLLLGAAGFVTWGVVGGRRRLLPVWAAAWCAVGGLFAIVGSEAGLSAIIGTFWLWYAASWRRRVNG